MKSSTHFLARKLRQYRYRAKQLRRFSSEKEFSLNAQQRLWVRQLQRLYSELKPYHSGQKLRKIAAGAAIFLGLHLNHTQAQDFLPPVINPWQFESENFWPIQEFVDIDNDGDLDLFLAGYGPFEYYFNLKFYENIGSPFISTFIEFQMDPFGVEDDQVTNPTFGDLDADGDLDMLIGGYGMYSGVRYYENVGDAENPAFDNYQYNPFGLGDAEYFSFVHLADFDADGDLDLFVSESQGIFTYYENIGDPLSPSFASPQTNPFGIGDLLGPIYVRAFDFVDFDDDGDLDLFVHDYDTSYDEGMFYLENTGGANNPAFTSVVEAPFNLQLNAYSAVHLHAADFDNDGDIDLTAGVYYGGLQFFENLGDNIAPTSADFSITTNFETAYNFSGTEFPFFDPNSDDQLDKISIESIPSGGILTMAGGPALFGGEEIGQSSLMLLSYVPDDGGFGLDYDQFQFKVADDDVFSAETYTVSITVDPPSAVQEVQSSGRIQLRQNPVYQMVRFQASEALAGDFRVFNGLGQLVLEGKVDVLPGEEGSFSVATLPTGHYWLQIQTEKQMLIVDFLKH